MSLKTTNFEEAELDDLCTPCRMMMIRMMRKTFSWRHAIQRQTRALRYREWWVVRLLNRMQRLLGIWCVASNQPSCQRHRCPNHESLRRVPIGTWNLHRISCCRTLCCLTSIGLHSKRIPFYHVSLRALYQHEGLQLGHHQIIALVRVFVDFCAWVPIWKEKMNRFLGDGTFQISFAFWLPFLVFDFGSSVFAHFLLVLCHL